MASALQKLFRKRISKQQIQEQRQKQEAEAEAARKASEAAASPRKETQPYLTVSSLNSPSASSLHFPFSSKLSLNTYSGQIGEDGSFSASPQRMDLSRQDSNSSYYNTRQRAASLSAASMMRDLSDGSERRRASNFYDTDTITDQFGALIEGNVDTQGLLSEEEDELDGNLVYAALTHRDSLSSDWNMAKLVLVPSKTLDLRQQNLTSDAYIACHALSPSNLFKDQYVSVRSFQSNGNQKDAEDPWSGLTLTATLQAESRKVHLVISRPAGRPGEQPQRVEHTASVSSETTVYRSMSSQEIQSASATQGQKRSRRERARIRVLIIDGSLIPNDTLSRLDSLRLPGGLVRTDSEQSFMTQLQNRQKQSSTGAIAFPQSSPTLDNAPSPQKTLSPLPDANQSNLEISSMPPRRQFLADFAFLLDPPEDLHLLQAPLHAALDTLIRAANDFTSAYVYVSGFDAYNVSRIRRGILSKAWQAFEATTEGEITRLDTDSRARLLLLLENVVMGHCHGKIYSSIRGVYRSDDEAVDNVICTYQELQVSLDDLGVGFPAICRRPALLDRAIFIAKHLGDADEDMEHLLVDRKVDLIRSLAKQGDLTSGRAEANLYYYNPEKNRGRIRTPLDIFDVMQATLEEIGSALERANKTNGLGASLGTDELLPILAYVLIRAGQMKLVSMLYYARHFGLSDAISSQANWALVTHDAVVEYLRKDPLHLCSAKSPTCGSSVSSFSSQSTLFSNPMSRASTQMERINSNSEVKRERRCSLPSSILLSSLTSGESEVTLPSCITTSDMPSNVSSTTEEDRNTSDTGFKVPGRPASAYAIASRSRVMSALDVVGEDGIASHLPGNLVSPTFPRSPSSVSKRTTSMSGTGDLHIRPQIVVRPTKGSSRSPTTSTGSGGRVHLSDINTTVRSLDRTLSLGSKKMSRTGSEEPPNRRLADQGAIAVSMPKHARRKSLDSWASFSFFGSGTVPSTPGESSKATTSATTSPTADVSPSNSSQGYPTTPTSLASSPTMWLSSWTSDWTQRRKDSLPALEHRISSDAGSRQGSITSNEDSMTLLRKYSSSSSNNHQSSQQVRSDDLQAPERRRRRPAVRTRLLSTSTPTDPLPPKVYPDTAMGDYFHREHAFGSISPTSISYTPLAASVRLHSALTPSSDRAATAPNLIDSSSILSPPPSIGTVQIPTPVEEINDPMSTANAL